MKKCFLTLSLIFSVEIFAQEYKQGFIPLDDGNKIFYQKVGTGKQFVVIPLGFMLYDDFKRLAAPDRTLIFYDMRNRGRSTQVHDSNAISVYHDISDLETLRQYFKIDKMTLIGESYLGKMVILYALKYPGKVTKIVQIGAVPMKLQSSFPDSLDNTKDYGAVKEEYWNELQQMRKDGLPQKQPEAFSIKNWNNFERWWLVSDSTYFEKMGKHWGSHLKFRNEQADLLERHFRYHFKSMQTADISKEELKKLDIPVLTIHGRKDRNAPFGSGKEWSENIPNATFVAISNAAHMPWIENPDLVFDSINNFLK